MTKKSGSKCSKGMIERKGYTSKRGTKTIKVPTSCIKSTSYKGVKRSILDKKKIAQREKIQKRIGKKYGSKKCTVGNIERAGFVREGFNRRSFVRKNGTIVRATNVRGSEVPPICVRDTGAHGKGIKLPLVLERGDLKKYGYENIKNLSTQQRQHALRIANNNIHNPLSLFRKLNVLATMNKNKDSKLAKIFKDDAYWVRENFNTIGNESNGTSNKSSGSKSSGSKSTRSKSTGSKSSGSKSTRSKLTKPIRQYGSKRNYSSGLNTKNSKKTTKKSSSTRKK